MEHAERAFAKLNITLDVVRKLPDGYHELKMIMESVALYDKVVIKLDKGQGISVKTNLSYLPNNDSNIAAKAAKLFFQEQGIKGYKAHIDIKKRIPVCAGMAGGSSDAAAVLRGLNEVLGTKLSAGQLEKMGEKLGSDVPYCIAGGTVLSCGRGERLTALEPMPKCSIVICKPIFSVSTPEFFSRIDCERIRNRPDTDGVIEALKNHDLRSVARRMYNVFEDVPHRGRKEIADIKASLLDNGAIGAAMSGTGPSVFGLFDDRKSAEKAYKVLSRSYRDVFLTENIRRLKV